MVSCIQTPVPTQVRKSGFWKTGSTLYRCCCTANPSATSGTVPGAFISHAVSCASGFIFLINPTEEHSHTSWGDYLLVVLNPLFVLPWPGKCSFPQFLEQYAFGLCKIWAGWRYVPQIACIKFSSCKAAQPRNPITWSTNQYLRLRIQINQCLHLGRIMGRRATPDKLKTSRGWEGSGKHSQKILQNIKLTIIAVLFSSNSKLKDTETELRILASQKDLALATEPSVTISEEPQSALNLINKKVKITFRTFIFLRWAHLSARFYRLTVKPSHFLSYLHSVARLKDTKNENSLQCCKPKYCRMHKQLRHMNFPAIA